MRAVDQVPHLRRLDRHLHVLVRDVLEQRDEVDLLLVVAAEAHARLRADDRQHRLMVQLCVVEPVEVVDRSRAGGGEANADLAGPFRMRTGHEGGLLLVAHLHELELVLVALERADDRVDPVAGIAVDALDAVLGEALEQEICGELGHGDVIPMAKRAKRGKRPGGPLPALEASAEAD